MHKFVTTSGKELWYDVNTNRISLWDPIKNQQTCPVVHFDAPTNIRTDKITLFTLEMTQQCNLRCTYCCYSGEYRGRRQHNKKEISFRTLEKVIDFIISHADKSADEITVCFYGGEALLAKRKIEWVIKQLDCLLGKKVRYSLSTNGFALTESVVDWICSNEKFFVNVTIDGDEPTHDKHRVTRNGEGSFSTIIRNLSLFKKKYPEQYDRRIRFLSTVYLLGDVAAMSTTWDNYDVLKGHYPVHISHIIPNISDSTRVYDTRNSKDAFYLDAFRDYKAGIESIRAIYFKKLISIIEHRSYTHLIRVMKIKTCYQDLFSCYINADGDLYACEKFCEEFKMGDVNTGFDSTKTNVILQKFAERKNKFCKSCWAQRLCRMCLTGLNHTDDEIVRMCEMERDTIDLALKYYCEMIDWKQNTKKKE